MRDGIEPGAHGARIAIGARVANQPDERLLRQILGHVRARQDPIEMGEQGGVVPLDECLQCCRIGVLPSAQEIFIGDHRCFHVR
jgi:hypothetical protein